MESAVLLDWKSGQQIAILGSLVNWSQACGAKVEAALRHLHEYLYLHPGSMWHASIRVSMVGPDSRNPKFGAPLTEL